MSERRHDRDPVIDAALTALERRPTPTLLASEIKLRVECAAAFPDARPQPRRLLRLVAGLLVPPAAVGLLLGLLALVPASDDVPIYELGAADPGEPLSVTDDDALLAIAFGSEP